MASPKMEISEAPSSIAGDHPPIVGSQSWFSFFNGRYRSPAALPISALFFFESKAARLIFVRRCWPCPYAWPRRLSGLFICVKVRAARRCSPQSGQDDVIHFLTGMGGVMSKFERLLVAGSTG